MAITERSGGITAKLTDGCGALQSSRLVQHLVPRLVKSFLSSLTNRLWTSKHITELFDVI